ncbi:MAG: SDR family oxidoreductase [Psychrosphaera sp.]|nr:SDR family oxidoreductase [Psychrosphaera sp.]
MKREKTVLITGGNSGIGFATAQQFLNNNHNVLISGRNEQALAQAKENLGNDNVYTYLADVAKLDDLDSLYSKIDADGFKLDSLVVNAGISTAAPLDLIDETHFDLQIGVNLKGALFTFQKALGLMDGGATVVFITSIVNQAASPPFSVYAASKGAVASMVNTLAVEVIGRNIRVNSVSPGPIETEIFDKMGMEEAQMAGVKTMICEKSPSGRFGKAAEVASAVYFLCSEQSSYIVGHELVIDGGMSLL